MHPDWIVQSCARKELLKWTEFQLYARQPGQGALPFSRLASKKYGVAERTRAGPETAAHASPGQAEASSSSLRGIVPENTLEQAAPSMQSPLPTQETPTKPPARPAPQPPLQPLSSAWWSSSQWSEQERAVAHAPSSNLSEGVVRAQRKLGKVVRANEQLCDDELESTWSGDFNDAALTDDNLEAVADLSPSQPQQPQQPQEPQQQEKEVSLDDADQLQEDSEDYQLDDQEQEENEQEEIEQEEAASARRRHWPSGSSVLAAEAQADQEWLSSMTTANPDFIQRYYATSRLHFLSTWKNEIIARLRTERASLPPDHPLAVGASSSSSRGRHGNPVIMHVDMDCFFASVSLADRPELRDRPVCISHSRGGTGEAATAEVASSNYAARAFGIKNGSSISAAKRACPDVVVLPYEFEKYRVASEGLYSVLLRFADDLEAVSCDEAFIDVGSRVPPGADGELRLAAEIRAAILERTRCPASIGISHNLMLARCATRLAKPDGQHFVSRDRAEEVMGDMPVRDLPGVGWALAAKLNERHGVTMCRELRAIALPALQRDYGPKIGQLLHARARGIDTRTLTSSLNGGGAARQTVGAEINWGVRFETEQQARKFVADLAAEVVRRMGEAGVRGRTIMMNAKKARHQDVNAPRKFLGHGPCDNMSKSTTLLAATADAAVIEREALLIYQSLGIAPKDLRGLGIHLSKLEPTSAAPAAGASIHQFLKPQRDAMPSSAADVPMQQTPPPPPARPAANVLQMLQSNEKATSSALPGSPLPTSPVLSASPSLPAAPTLPTPAAPRPNAEDVDMETLMQLPPDIRHEIAAQYGILLLDDDSILHEAAPPPPPPAPAPAPPPPPKSAKRKAPAASSSRKRERPLLPTPTAAAAIAASLPPLSELDPITLLELPDDVRAELLRMYKPTASSAAAPSKAMPEIGAARQALSPLPEAVAAALMPPPPPPPQARKANPFEARSTDDARSLISEWVNYVSTSGESIEMEDVDVFVNYVVELVDAMQLERANALLSWLVRCTRGRVDWVPYICHIEERVQRRVQVKHGAPLLLKV